MNDKEDQVSDEMEDNVENYSDEQDINSMEPGQGGGLRNFIKTPFSSIANKFFGNKSSNGKKSGFAKIISKLPLKVKIILLVALVAVVFIAAIVLLIEEDSAKNSVSIRNDAVSSLGIDENSSEIEKNALNLYEQYDSLIGFNDEQLSKLASALKENDKPETLYLREAGSKVMGTSNDKYKVSNKMELYDHIQRTEKYNFNNIVWKEYTHNEDAKDLKTKKRDDLGLIVPDSIDDKTLITLLNTTAPYLLTNDIPLGFLCGLVSYSSSSDKNMVAEKLTYEIIKEAQTKLTMNKYTLRTVKYNTTYDEYDTTHYKGQYVIKVKDNEVSLVSINYNVDGEVKRNTTNERKISNDSVTEDVYWYVSDAKTYDSKITNEFEYKKYNDSDVANMTNPNSNVLVSTTEINRINGKKIESISDIPSSVILSVKNPLNTKFTNSDDGGKLFTFSTEYSQDIGNTYVYEKEWKDKCSPKKSENIVYNYDDIKQYNISNDENYKNIDTDKKKNENFNGENPYKKYEETDTLNGLYGISLIDFIDSNNGTYMKYVPSKSFALSEIEGLGRYNMKDGYQQTKTVLNLLSDKLEEKNQNSNTTNSSKKILPFVYGSSLGYDISKANEEIIENDTSASISGKDLLKAYIHSVEGNTGLKEENGVRYYKVGLVGKDKHRTVGMGLDLETSGKESELIESAKRAGFDISTADGAWIPADLVDAITDTIIDKSYEYVVSLTDGLNLKEYQLHALVSRKYNAGYYDKVHDFANAYRTLWNEERDDKYKEVQELYGEKTAIDLNIEKDILSKVDYNTPLYVNYMSEPDNGGELVNRRNSEWVLFQTGYYGYRSTVKKLYKEGGSIVDCAEYVHEYMEKNKYTYCVYGGNSYEECGNYGKKHGLDPTFEESKTGHHNTCCATFVSWVLQEAGYMTREEHVKYNGNGANSLARFLENQKGFTRHKSTEMEAGDVMVYNYGHVQLYAGDKTTYNAGCGEAIRRDAPHTGYNTPDYVLRAPN